MKKILIHKNIEELKSLAGVGKEIFVVIDSKLRHLHHNFAGYTIIEVSASEQNKSVAMVMEIVEKLLHAGADRDAFILGVGGGIVTDMAGFAASIYKRGVEFAFVPTTLLAQVDASIGGKNGVNFESYKNIVGTITQPQWVYICAEVLRTLGGREFKAGIAEVLKTFVLFDVEYYNMAVEYFAELEQLFAETGSYLVDGEFYHEERLLDIIGRCAQYKSGVVERDEFEKGERRMLNLGHSFAHAIEKVCADSENYTPIMHGEAVSIGMVLAANLATKYYGGLSCSFAKKLKGDLKRIGLPVEIPCNSKGEQIPMEALIDALRKDKKVTGDSIHFILPKEVGEVEDVLVPLNIVEELANDLC